MTDLTFHLSSNQLTEQHNASADWPSYRTANEVLSMELSKPQSDQSIPIKTLFSIPLVGPNLSDTKLFHS